MLQAGHPHDTMRCASTRCASHVQGHRLELLWSAGSKLVSSSSAHVSKLVLQRGKMLRRKDSVLLLR
jgi:hypothetical protein